MANRDILSPVVPANLVEASDKWAKETIIDDGLGDVKQTLGNLFVGLWEIAKFKRAPLLGQIANGGNIERIYKNWVTLGDGTKLDANDLLTFRLHEQELDAPDFAPEGAASKYSITLGVGGPLGEFRGSHPAGEAINYMYWYDRPDSIREMEATGIFEAISSPDFRPDEVRIIEAVETTLATPSKDGEDPGFRALSRHSSRVWNSYGVEATFWTPNLGFFGIDEDLPETVELSFSPSSPDSRHEGTDHYGLIVGDKIRVAQALARMRDLTEFLAHITLPNGFKPQRKQPGLPQPPQLSIVD